MGHFQIFVSGAPGTVDDWREALNAPEGDVPALTEGEKELMRRLQADENEYARAVLATRLSQQRNETTARVLGEKIDDILLGIRSAYYQLSAVLRNETTGHKWVARVITPKGVKNIEIPPELVSGIIQDDSDSKFKLRTVILAGVDRADLLEKKSE